MRERGWNVEFILHKFQIGSKTHNQKMKYIITENCFVIPDLSAMTQHSEVLENKIEKFSFKILHDKTYLMQSQKTINWGKILQLVQQIRTKLPNL